MKKNSILLIMFISLFFIFDKNVFAIGSCTCVYGTDTLGFKIEVSDSGTPKVTITGTAKAAAVLGTTNFAPVNFQDTATKKWKCPSTIYYEVNGSGRSVTYKNLSVTKPESGTVSQSGLVGDKSSDGDLYEANESGEETNTIYCVYGNLTLTIDNSNQVVNGSNAGCTSIGLPSYDTLSDKTKCPVYIYGLKAAVPGISGFTCRYSWTSSTGYSKIDINGSEPVIDASGTIVNTTVKTTENTASYDTGCPLGVDVTKDIYGLLKILKIVAPLLVVGLTVFEFVKAIARSEIDGEAKKLGMRLVKRLIIAVILFFLPVLVNQIMIMANIWDENGTCDFSKSADQIDSSKSGGVVTNITTTTTTTTTVGGHTTGGGGAHTSPSGVEHGGGGHRR